MDFNALRDRLNQLNRKISKGDDLWKPKDEHQVRLVPNPHADDPFQELHFHYEIGDTLSVLCPKLNFGEECAICDFADVLKAWKGPDGEDKPEKERKADFEIFKKIQAKARIYVPMIERPNKEKNIAGTETAKWWGMTTAQVNQALEVCTDGDRLEELGLAKDDPGALKVLFDTKKGYDLTVSFAKPGEKGNTKTFTQITIKGRIKPSPLAKDEAEVKKIAESVKKLPDVFPKVPSAEVEKILKKFLGAGAPEAKTEGGTEKYAKTEEKETPKPANSKENAKTVGGRSIDEAFGDMLAEDA
jgi:hypothetical protein